MLTRMAMVLCAACLLLFTGEARAVYQVEAGRFLQADPYATGVPTTGHAGSFHGRTPLAAVGRFNLGRHLSDGVNPYLYLRSDPYSYVDPLGLNTYAELGAVGGFQAFLVATLNGAASLTTSVNALMASGYVWAMNATATGALVVVHNFDPIMMFASHMDASSGNWDDAFEGLGGSGGGPQYDPKNMTTSEPLLARDWGVTVKQIGDGMHMLKEDGKVSGAVRNPDLIINRNTGDAFIKGTTEYVGNLKEVLGL